MLRRRRRLADDLAPVVWLERLEKASNGGLPLLKVIPASDPRVADANRLIDNEAATFTRTLVAWAWQTFGTPPTWPDGRLAILLQPGGNNASVGFRLQEAGGVIEHADVPYHRFWSSTRAASATP